ncbi:type II toxin-antitoxin system death-on-curing family toxin [Aerococcus loyolae]|uniref:Type II toxin-antitoxin system death-on-curing family toxin n=1 Tax=Aerococcus urinae TaxID=1376 RepID=A0A2I1L694_9LACT|nr:death-on-curing protein [Aerococcus loyolae]PKY84921.1 type II toxin-antitoxin system death-on-curing family toxin [Aerococcus loyolae]PKZ03398.1 type II toxin-antitoxin system death-on-curing family toxin [Aerococcus loyolae]RAV80719.1 type II toxin-antitoxin system death-on-curing family toxin [Aerococcus loyolae]
MDFAINIHDYVIDEIGGLKGIKDYGQLESVLIHIQNDDYYPSFLDKLTHLVFSLVKFHMFNDGNKRTAISLGGYFMNLNHYTYAVDDFIIEMEDIVVKVAENSISKDDLKIIIKDILDI